jgi:hypothetical protein
MLQVIMLDLSGWTSGGLAVEPLLARARERFLVNLQRVFDAAPVYSQIEKSW